LMLASRRRDVQDLNRAALHRARRAR
jgi:hypothetical protein